MVRPVHFGFNDQTARDNKFQSMSLLPETELNRTAQAEFDNAVHTIRNAGIHVVTVEGDTQTQTPDAIFPNNWFSTDPDGTVIVYPMLAPNRRAERELLPKIEAALAADGFEIHQVVTIGRFHEANHFLEGTGSMVIDHVSRIVYACNSDRTSSLQLSRFMQSRGYEMGFLFHAETSQHVPVYHTNIMMSIGEDFALICPDLITKASARDAVLTQLSRNREIIQIGRNQAENGFCGNILQVRTPSGEMRLLMSDLAFKTFDKPQLQQLARHGKVVPLNIDTIERIGGGSARCMMAEVFLPQTGTPLNLAGQHHRPRLVDL